MDVKITKHLDDQENEPPLIIASSSQNAKSNRNCDICSKPMSAQYTCPRCNKSYCNLACYQSPEHMNCSEEFYKQQVLDQLKNCQINNDDDKGSKIADILKRDRKRLEELDDELVTGVNDSLSSETSSDDEDDDDDENVKKSPLDANPDELIRAYENEIRKWKPWWTVTNPSVEIVVVDKPLPLETSICSVNKRLQANSSSVNVSNASELFYHEVLQTSYLYIILVYVYQLDDRDLDALISGDDSREGQVDLDLLDEMCSAFLQCHKMLVGSAAHLSSTDLAARFELIIANLLQKENYFLKGYINKHLLSNLLDDLVVFCKHPMKTHAKSLSHLYTLLETSLKKKKKKSSSKRPQNEESAELSGLIERPLNVFHMNKDKKQEDVQDKQYQENNLVKKCSRVEILSKRGAAANKMDANKKNDQKSSSTTATKTSEETAKLLNLADDESVKKEAKLFLKKLEFEFKWMSENMSSVQSSQVIDTLATSLSSLRDSLQKDIQEFDADKKLITENMDFLRKKVTESNKKLIEEL